MIPRISTVAQEEKAEEATGANVWRRKFEQINKSETWWSFKSETWCRSVGVMGAEGQKLGWPSLRLRASDARWQLVP